MCSERSHLSFEFQERARLKQQQLEKFEYPIAQQLGASKNANQACVFRYNIILFLFWLKWGLAKWEMSDLLSHELYNENSETGEATFLYVSSPEHVTINPLIPSPT